MGKDYYGILGVSPQAPECEISKKFRVLALTYHPEKNKQNMAQSNYLFSQVCEAYEVLSNPPLREIYDKYGEDQLKNGIPDPKLGMKGGYRFSGNSYDIFEKFFGTSNPFTVALDDEGNQISMVEQFNSQVNRVFGKRFQDLYIKVECTLEEFYHGCKKEVFFERVVMLGDERSEKFTVIGKEIEIKPGMGLWTELKFPQEGHFRYAHDKSDLIVKFVEIPHQKFKRHGNDLVYNHKISLLDSLKSIPIHFTTIDNEVIEVAVDEVISPSTVKVIKGKGMPLQSDDPLGPIKQNFERGNLIVKFDIEFPKQLSDQQRQELTEILDEDEQ